MWPIRLPDNLIKMVSIPPDVHRMLSENSLSVRYNRFGFYQKQPKEHSTSRNEAIWFGKDNLAEGSKIIETIVELIAGELYRFLIGPTQPKTRIEYIAQDNKLRLYSKAIVGFKDFLTYFSEAINMPKEQLLINNKYPSLITMRETVTISHLSKEALKSLARIVISAMFLQEVDLKPDNFGFNEDYVFVKIDHDRSFKRFRKL